MKFLYTINLRNYVAKALAYLSIAVGLSQRQWKFYKSGFSQ